ncbi:MAG: hypothetical protein IT325_06655 [Anaerolineae bacterium]|nr:hypothetical protein [Anaerolineae bacterium]
MNSSRKPFGGVIAAPDQQTQAVVTLLSHYVRARFDLVYYAHAKEIDLQRRHDFLVVLSVGDLEAVAGRLNGNGYYKPLIVHIDDPATLGHLDYEAFFPGLEVISIEQADLAAQPDVTLRIELFRQVIEALEARI